MKWNECEKGENYTVQLMYMIFWIPCMKSQGQTPFPEETDQNNVWIG